MKIQLYPVDTGLAKIVSNDLFDMLVKERDSYREILLVLVELGRVAKAIKLSPLGNLCEQARAALEEK